MISTAWARGPIRTCWWALACLCLGSSQSMCGWLRSGRNRWWLLIKLSIPLRVIPPLQTHPHHMTKKSEKILSFLTKTRLPHNLSGDQKSHPHTQKSYMERTLRLQMLLWPSAHRLWMFSKNGSLIDSPSHAVWPKTCLKYIYNTLSCWEQIHSIFVFKNLASYTISSAVCNTVYQFQMSLP